jgi:hypothetical protein
MSWGRQPGAFAFVTDKLVSHKPAAVFLGEHESGVHAADRDDTPAREALTLAFMVLVNYCHVRADETHFRRLFAHHS